MTKAKNIIGKLLRVAVYTSVLIAILSTIPFFITIKAIPLILFPIFFASSFVNFYMVWLVNILLVRTFDKSAETKNKPFKRYVYSYLFTVTLSGLYIILMNRINLPELIAHNYEDFAPHAEKGFYAPFLMGFFSNSFVLLMQELILLREKKTKIELENAQLKIENVKAFNSQLKQQVHPHFLFNSLSVLKSLINKSPDIAEEYIVRLSDFLRVSISSNESNVVSLKEEVKLCEDFMEMQKIRFGNALSFSFNIPEKILNIGCVPGFSIQVLLENAIKHNVLTDSSPLVISITYIQGWICVSNNIQKKLSIEQSTKSGLANLTERYKIISGDRVIVKEDENSFSVNIKVLENEYSNN
ncbi:MAG: sensor histidine kinase [Bacteroidales bacterium]